MALEFGSAWHKAMDEWHTSRTLTTATEVFNQHFTDGQDRKRTRATAATMLRRYAEKYAHETFTVVSNEQWLEIPVGGFLYVMRIDKVVEEDGEIKGLEHKTTSSLGYHYIKGFKPNLQLAGYIKGLQVRTNPAIKTMLIDAALVGSREPREGETLLRYPEHVDVWELEEFTGIVEDLGHALTKYGTAFEYFTPNWNACTLYGECAYRQLCMAPPEVREKLVEMHYQPKEERDANR